MLVVNSAIRGFQLPGFKQVVVDSHAGVQTITKDIIDGKLQVVSLRLLMLCVGRADILDGEEVSVVLHGLQEALNLVAFCGRVVLVGLMPESQDRGWACRKIRKAWECMEWEIEDLPGFEISRAARILIDDRGVVPQLINYNGLTLDVQQEFSLHLGCFING